MFTRTLNRIASTAALLTLGSTAMADYDCFSDQLIGTNPPPLTQLRCPENTSLEDYAWLLLKRQSATSNNYRLQVRYEGFDTKPGGAPETSQVWVTAFAFDAVGTELEGCSIHPSVPGYEIYGNDSGVCAYTDNGAAVKPAEIVIYAAQD
jgi:hypothetical protein